MVKIENILRLSEKDYQHVVELLGTPCVIRKDPATGDIGITTDDEVVLIIRKEIRLDKDSVRMLIENFFNGQTSFIGRYAGLGHIWIANHG